MSQSAMVPAARADGQVGLEDALPGEPGPVEPQRHRVRTLAPGDGVISVDTP